MDLLTIHLTEGSPCVLHVDGEIDIASAGQLEKALAAALAANPELVVDMRGVTFMDASGLRVILDAAETLNGHGPLALVNAPLFARLLEVLELGGLPSVEVREMG